MAKFALTTIDNPFNPFTEFDQWFAFDERHGYESNRMLAAIAITSDELPEAMQDEAIEEAIDQIVSENPLLIYRKAVNHSSS